MPVTFPKVITALASAVAGAPIAPADTIGINWPFWRGYFVQQVLLGNNITDGTGELPPVSYTFFGTLVTFLITRGITRFIRHRSSGSGGAGGPTEGGAPGSPAGSGRTGIFRDIVIRGVHIHHQVFGIVLMLLSGVVLIDVRPNAAGLAVLATAFGVGVGLAFDEFALWLHLDDVYWRQEGRKSIDAVAIVLVVNGVVAVITSTISDLHRLGPAIDALGPSVRWFVAGIVALTFVPAVICLLKGKTITAGVGVAYLPLGFVGACRLGKPGSWWAGRFYRPSSRRLARATVRFGERYDARWNRIRTLVGGAPTEPV